MSVRRSRPGTPAVHDMSARSSSRRAPAMQPSALRPLSSNSMPDIGSHRSKRSSRGSQGVAHLRPRPGRIANSRLGESGLGSILPFCVSLAFLCKPCLSE
jgi:hypothetical protein